MELFPTPNLKVILSCVVKHLLKSKLICVFKNIVMRKNNIAKNIIQCQSSLRKITVQNQQSVYRIHMTSLIPIPFIPSHSHHDIPIPIPMKLE